MPGNMAQRRGKSGQGGTVQGTKAAQNGSTGPALSPSAPSKPQPKSKLVEKPAPSANAPETASPAAVICSSGVLIAHGTSIDVYDCDTLNGSADLRGTFDQHSATVTDVQLHPLDADQVASVSVEGELLLWRPSDYSLTLRVAIAAEVFAMRLIARAGDEKPELRAVLVLRKAGKRDVSILLVSLTEQLHPWDVCTCPTTTPLFSTSATLLAVSKDCETVLLFDPWKWQSKNALIKFNEEQSQRHRDFQRITSVACHPTRQEVALGLRGGQLRVFSTVAKDQLVTMQHWHSKAILSLAFSSDGGLLFSGGEEAVLVAWNTGTWKRTTLPRFASPVTGLQLSPSDSHVLVKCCNNALHVVNLTRFTVECSLYTQANGNPRKLVPAANGMYGIVSDAESLRFYDAKVSRINCALLGTKLNTLVAADTESLPQTRITDVAFSETGSWLATVEESSLTLQGHHLSTLKWWKADANRFDVVAEAYDVHRTVHTLLFHPSRELLLTAGGDGLIKSWESRVVDDSDDVQKTRPAKKSYAVTWSCTATHPCSSGTASALCFSTDEANSILFVTRANAVALCRVDTFAEITRLRQEDDRCDLRQVQCLLDGRHLVARSDHNLFVWDVPQRSLVWCARLSATRLVSLPFFSSFAAVSQNRIFEFGVESACPSFISDPLVNAKTRQSVVDVHVHSSVRGHNYVFLTSAGQVAQFSPSSPSLVITTGEAPAVEQRRVTPTVAPQPLAVQHQALVVAKAVAPCNFLTRSDATHSIPALSSMLESFMRNYLTESSNA